MEDLQHFIPKLGLTIFEINSNQINTFLGDVRIPQTLEPNIGASIAVFISINLNPSFFGLDLFRMEKVEDGQRVMNGWIWKFIGFVVHCFELDQHVMNCSRKGDVFILREVLDNLIGCHVLMGHL